MAVDRERPFPHQPPDGAGRRRVLVVGWWSVFHGEATAGDLEAGAAAQRWLDQAGIANETAWSPAFSRSPTLDELSPADFSDVMWVCGPATGGPLVELLDRFSSCRRILLGASVVDPPVTDRFDVVWPRDNQQSGAADTEGWPDLSFALPHQTWPLVAVVRANEQPEYRGARHAHVHQLIDATLADLPLALLDVDTRVDPRSPRQRSERQVARLVAAADAAVSTRLHGLVLALRAGVPAVAIDPVLDGAKVSAQARTLGWPAVVPASELTSAALTEQLSWCLSPEARQVAGDVRDAAAGRLRRLAGAVTDTLGAD